MSQTKYKPVQGSIYDPLYQMSDRQRRRLQNSWAADFKMHILPVLISAEDIFAPLYSSTQCRLVNFQMSFKSACFR